MMHIIITSSPTSPHLSDHVLQGYSFDYLLSTENYSKLTDWNSLPIPYKLIVLGFTISSCEIRFPLYNTVHDMMCTCTYPCAHMTCGIALILFIVRIMLIITKGDT